MTAAAAFEKRLTDLAGFANAAADVVTDVEEQGDLMTEEAAAIRRSIDAVGWLIEELRAARKDTARFDWLDEVTKQTNRDHGVSLAWVITRQGHIHRDAFDPRRRDSVRGAIDAAMEV